MQLFTSIQLQTGVFRTIHSDVVMSFESTVDVFANISTNKLMLIRMKERERRDSEICPLELHFTEDDFDVLKQVVDIQQSVQSKKRSFK